MAIEPNDMELLKAMFVSKKDCDDYTEKNDERLAKGSTDFALIIKELTWLKWLLFASIGERLLSFFSGIIQPYLNNLR